MNEKMNAVLDELRNSEISNLDFYFQLSNGLKSIQLFIDDVRFHAGLTPAEREKLECASSLSQLLRKSLKLDEFDSVVELLGIDKEAV